MLLEINMTLSYWCSLSSCYIQIKVTFLGYCHYSIVSPLNNQEQQSPLSLKNMWSEIQPMFNIKSKGKHINRCLHSVTGLPHMHLKVMRFIPTCLIHKMCFVPCKSVLNSFCHDHYLVRCAQKCTYVPM